MLILNISINSLIIDTYRTLQLPDSFLNPITFLQQIRQIIMSISNEHIILINFQKHHHSRFIKFNSLTVLIFSQPVVTEYYIKLGNCRIVLATPKCILLEQAVEEIDGAC